uniref:Uncharacterized protein n=2 Tax=Canis lupus familiaris TaxID=9615 RepID=A0A8C0PRL0_CANLF
MKAFLAVGGLYLLFSVIWTCSGEQPVYIRCSPSWFLARVKPTAFHNDLLVDSDEVFLGDQCPVTSVHQGFYEFRYHPKDCNIRIEVLPGDHILFVSEIIFISKFSDLEASIPVACIVPQHPAPIIITTGSNANKQGGLKRSPRMANLYIGETVNRKEKTAKKENSKYIQLYVLHTEMLLSLNGKSCALETDNYVNVQFCYLTNHTAHPSAPENLGRGYESL